MKEIKKILLKVMYETKVHRFPQIMWGVNQSNYVYRNRTYSYSYLQRMLQELTKEGFIQTYRIYSDRCIVYDLTNEGDKLAKKLLGAREMNETKQGYKYY